MKAKYKLGDWVYFQNPATDKKEVAKVVETYDDGKVTVELANGKRLLAMETDISGIPMTEEIFKKNGYNPINEVDYVHELQHWLWALGGEDELKI